MQIVAHNLVSMFTSRQLNISSNKKTASAEKLSSGYRINRAADDAAGLSISEKMRYQIRGLERGSKNTQEGISFIQVADGAMQEIHSMIQRIRELSVQASNDTNTLSDKQTINEEIKHIRNEINRVCSDTEFNHQPVFQDCGISMEISGQPRDLQIFDSTYDDATGEVNWGGFIFHGNRVTWDKVDPDMVTTDASGQQIFAGGEYSYTDPASGYTYQISCKEGDNVPKITRTVNILAGSSGILIDGKNFAWNQLHDMEGIGLSDNTIHAGTWVLDYEGADLTFNVGANINSIADMARAINNISNETEGYSYKMTYSGTAGEKAVDANIIKNLKVTNNLNTILGDANQLDIKVRAGKDGSQNGIWLEKDGTAIADSFRTWGSMGITSWDSGTDINSSYTYVYEDKDGSNDTYISFEFKLSDVTSIDSVIDGLDNMSISSKDIKTKYGVTTTVNKTAVKNLEAASCSSSNNKVSFEEEKALGRDFDKIYNDVANTKLTYDPGNSKVTADFKDISTGKNVISYKGDTTQVEKEMNIDLTSYLSYIQKKKEALALAGMDPQKDDMATGDLAQLVGPGNITSAKNLNEILTIDTNTMTMTDGSSGYNPGINGKTYPSAFIDFQGLGSKYELQDLLGLGFNSTCNTCSNHYSIVFVQGATGYTTSSGYQYNLKSQNNDYLLQIDIGSLSGISDGKGLADALVEITSEKFDFHYTQYAARGSKFYIYDNRSSSSGAQNAKFGVQPHMEINKDVFDVSLTTDDGRGLNFSYTYDYQDIKDDVIVEMKESNSGTYVKGLDGKSYIKYNPSDPSMTNSQRYEMSVTYKKHSDSSQNVANAQDLVKDYMESAFQEMFQNSNVRLDAKDYTYMKLDGDENSNIAIKAVFDSWIQNNESRNKDLIIQNSSVSGDIIKIPRLSINTSLLKLDRINVETYETAQDTIRCTDYAINYISNRRSLYGAYQNRLEFTYNNSRNMLENTQAAESRIRDADMADEVVSYSKSVLLEQVGQAMLAQANQASGRITQLLQE